MKIKEVRIKFEESLDEDHAQELMVELNNWIYLNNFNLDKEFEVESVNYE